MGILQCILTQIEMDARKIEYKKTLRKYSCDGKVQHRSLLAANVALDRFIKLARDKNVAIYQCDYCKNYHIGHTKEKYN